MFPSQMSPAQMCLAQMSRVQRSPAQNIIEKRWWSYDDIVLRHNERERAPQNPELYMYSYFNEVRL